PPPHGAADASAAPPRGPQARRHERGNHAPGIGLDTGRVGPAEPPPRGADGVERARGRVRRPCSGLRADEAGAGHPLRTGSPTQPTPNDPVLFGPGRRASSPGASSVEVVHEPGPAAVAPAADPEVDVLRILDVPPVAAVGLLFVLAVPV